MQVDRTYRFSEDELLPISGLQHLRFCERQCALIHIEQVWSENRYTAEGRVMHERVHEQGHVSKGEVRVEYGIRLRSLELGLYGQADVVEFHKENGFWRPFPVEYKRGKPKKISCDEVQLCAQAICLEEMTGSAVSEGALFYGKTRRRKQVAFDSELRSEVAELAGRFHALVNAGNVPEVEEKDECKACSLRNQCGPGQLSGPRASAFVHNELMLACEASE